MYKVMYFVSVSGKSLVIEYLLMHCLLLHNFYVILSRKKFENNINIPYLVHSFYHFYSKLIFNPFYSVN
jgi:hypothetical protein